MMAVIGGVPTRNNYSRVLLPLHWRIFVQFITVSSSSLRFALPNNNDDDDDDDAGGGDDDEKDVTSRPLVRISTAKQRFKR